MGSGPPLPQFSSFESLGIDSDLRFPEIVYQATGLYYWHHSFGEILPHSVIIIRNKDSLKFMAFKNHFKNTCLIDLKITKWIPTEFLLKEMSIFTGF